MNGRARIAVLDASAHQDGRSQQRYEVLVANRPVITHVIEELADAGIGQVFVVPGPHTQAPLATLLRRGRPWQIDVSLVDSDAEQSVLSHLGEEATDAPVLLQTADCLFPGHLARLHQTLDDGDADAVVLVRSERSELTDSSTAGRLLRLPRDHPQGTAMLVAPSVWPVLGALSSATPSVAELTESLRRAGRRVELCEVGEHWCYCDSPGRLLEGNRMLLDSIPSQTLEAGAVKDSDTQGRVSVSPTARVVRSTLRGPALIGAEAVVEDSFIGPYTSVGPGATIVGVEIDNSIVLEGAQVRHPGVRVEGSVVGERALVTRSFGLPAALHLGVGRGASVVLG